MKRTTLTFCAIIFIFFSCTTNQGDGIFNVNAEITSIGHTMLSVKYYIGNTVIFDDIPMKSNAGILQMIKDSGKTTIPLKIVIEFLESEGDENQNESSFKYYYGANFLSESQSHNLESIVLIAKENQNIFNWQYRGGKHIKGSNKKSKSTDSDKPAELKSVEPSVRKETSEKL